MGAEIYIGTSGWHYRHWRDSFYPKDLKTQNWLEFYSKHFKTVELNNSFYRVPSAATFESWRDEASREFLFAVKGSRFITHMKKLKAPKSSTGEFFKAAKHLRTKLGPILFQLPPHWHVDVPRLDEFLSAVPKRHRYAVEFRDKTWYSDEVYETLKRHNAAVCIHDLAGRQTPVEITADFTYLRFHGPTVAKYSGSYPDSKLEKWAERINKWRRSLQGIYAYFNNDVGGMAPRNASKLKDLLNA